MTEHRVTLTPDELAEVIALPEGGTMTLRRAFDSQPPDGYTCLGIKGRLGWWFGGPGTHLNIDIVSPLGKSGDVLVHSGEMPVALVEPVYGMSTPLPYVIRLTVISVTPRLVDGTWVAEAEVRREK
jgi:hypothetical protein